MDKMVVWAHTRMAIWLMVMYGHGTVCRLTYRAIEKSATISLAYILALCDPIFSHDGLFEGCRLDILFKKRILKIDPQTSKNRPKEHIFRMC